MPFEPDIKHLARFPFLKKAQDFVKRRYPTLEALLGDPGKARILAAAEERILAAIEGDGKEPRGRGPLSPEDEILSYALSRILVSCIADKSMIDRLARYESDRAYSFLIHEGEDDENIELDESGFSPACKYVSRNIGLDLSSDRIPVIEYVELVAALHEERWRLVNRQLDRGTVFLKEEEVYELIRERIRVFIRRDLPYRVPVQVCEDLAPSCTRLKADYQAKALEQFGTVEEGSFPPCIRALIEAITAGTNLTHMGRFAITSFLHNIGMDTTQIAQFFARAPDFDPGRTMYQVEHISGRGGTEYKAPACAAMRTNGICVNKDKLCEKINHPLSYYKKKKWSASQKKSGSPSPAQPAGSPASATPSTEDSQKESPKPT
ncbi:MAG: DNA primase large subunit PriL [Methanoregulaceae archaeon]